MTAPKRYLVEGTGLDPRVRGQHQRALDNVARDFGSLSERIDGLSAADIAYTPGDSSDWVAPAPTTLQQALDRLAAAGGVTPVP